ncbi:hypothetical protein BDV93DRAFT_446185, partial [Ceratobasidium sp. AG-I]
SFQSAKVIEKSIIHDVEFFKSHPLILKESKISGWCMIPRLGRSNRLLLSRLR